MYTKIVVKMEKKAPACTCGHSQGLAACAGLPLGQACPDLWDAFLTQLVMRPLTKAHDHSIAGALAEESPAREEGVRPAHMQEEGSHQMKGRLLGAASWQIEAHERPRMSRCAPVILVQAEEVGGVRVDRHGGSCLSRAQPCTYACLHIENASSTTLTVKCKCIL